MKTTKGFRPIEGAQPLTENALAALENLEPTRRDFLKTAGVMMIGMGAVGTAAAQNPLNLTGNEIGRAHV